MACLVIRGNVSIILPRWQAQRVGGEYFSSLLGVKNGPGTGCGTGANPKDDSHYERRQLSIWNINKSL